MHVTNTHVVNEIDNIVASEEEQAASSSYFMPNREVHIDFEEAEVLTCGY